MFKNAIIFAVGVVVGSAATFFAVKSHYSKIAQEEIDSVKEVYKKKNMDIDGIIQKQIAALDIITKKVDATDKIFSTNDEVVETTTDEDEEESEIDEPDYDPSVERIFPDDGLSDEPYVISPDQFVQERPYYDKITMYYYEDTGQLLTEDGDLTEMDISIGSEALNHFGEYEKDVVYVRNDKIGIDYEVIHEENQPDILGNEEY